MESGKSDLLGSPLPGAIWLPHWRVRLERRGSAEVLAWRLAHSPEPPATIATTSTFVSLPRPVPSATIRRGEQRLRERLKRGEPGGRLSLEELMAAFCAAGGRVQLLRQIPPGAVSPFFGGAGALDDFIALADKPDEAIRAFAAHWGPLGICKHRIPWTHSLVRRSLTSGEPLCSPLGVAHGEGREGWEPLDIWRDYSREAKALTLEAIALRNSRERPKDRLWPLFLPLGRWLELAAVPLVTYPDVDTGKPWPCGVQVTFAITGVFQILALQLLGVVAGGRQIAQCTYCGLPFVLSGHREGSRRFCQPCIEKKIPTRYAARDYRARGRVLATGKTGRLNG